MTFSILQELPLFAHLTVQAISYSWENDNILIHNMIAGSILLLTVTNVLGKLRLKISSNFLILEVG